MSFSGQYLSITIILLQVRGENNQTVIKITLMLFA